VLYRLHASEAVSQLTRVTPLCYTCPCSIVLLVTFCPADVASWARCTWRCSCGGCSRSIKLTSSAQHPQGSCYMCHITPCYLLLSVLQMWLPGPSAPGGVPAAAAA
jgi:hypothetical protein